jgi:hypothetical protein
MLSRSKIGVLAFDVLVLIFFESFESLYLGIFCPASQLKHQMQGRFPSDIVIR